MLYYYMMYYYMLYYYMMYYYMSTNIRAKNSEPPSENADRGRFPTPQFFKIKM